MHTLKILIAASTFASSLVLMSAPAFADSRCDPQLVSTRTDFPAKSQLRGEHGVVHLLIKLAMDGRATDVQVGHSSGYRTLDHAAANSVRDHWRFDIAHCTEADLAVGKTVDVTFRRAPRQTLASTIDAKSIAQTKALAGNSQCHASYDETGTAIFACIKDAALNLASTQAAK
jgi:TonB family protein